MPSPRRSSSSSNYRRGKKKSRSASYAVPLATKVYRAMFVVGMIIGAFLTLFLPFSEWKFAYADRNFTLPFTVVKLQMWQRLVIYVLMVVSNGFFWARMGERVCEKHYPNAHQQKRTNAEPDDPNNPAQRRVYNLDG